MNGIMKSLPIVSTPIPFKFLKFSNILFICLPYVLLRIEMWIPAQIDHSGHRILRDPAGKMRESHRILQENTGNRWNMEARDVHRAYKSRRWRRGRRQKP